MPNSSPTVHTSILTNWARLELKKLQADLAKAKAKVQHCKDNRNEKAAVKDADSMIQTPEKAPLSTSADTPPQPKTTLPKLNCELGVGLIKATREIMNGDNDELKISCRKLFARAAAKKMSARHFTLRPAEVPLTTTVIPRLEKFSTPEIQWTLFSRRVEGF